MSNYSIDLSANITQTIRFQSTATGLNLKVEMAARVYSATQRGSGDTSNPLHSVCAYTDLGMQGIRISAYTNAQGWQFPEWQQ